MAEIRCKYSEMVDIEHLVPNPRNPNKHGEKQVKLIAKLLEFQGWRHPIIVSKRSGFVVVGHCRLESARLNGYQQVPVDYQEFKDEATEFQFLVSDNKSPELADHDDSLMISGIKDLGLEDMDFELLGLDDFQINWDSDIEAKDKIDGIDEDDGSLPSVIKITCNEIDKDEVLIYLKGKLLETGFQGIHIE